MRFGPVTRLLCRQKRFWINSISTKRPFPGRGNGSAKHIPIKAYGAFGSSLRMSASCPAIGATRRHVKEGRRGTSRSCSCTIRISRNSFATNYSAGLNAIRFGSLELLSLSSMKIFSKSAGGKVFHAKHIPLTFPARRNELFLSLLGSFNFRTRERRSPHATLRKHL